MVRILYLVLGMVSLVLGGAGVVLPLLPTVPFMLLAAFLFARSSPRLERWLVEHPRFGHHIEAWRTRRAISRKGKGAALICFAASAVVGLIFLPPLWSLVPLAAALIGGVLDCNSGGWLDAASTHIWLQRSDDAFRRGADRKPVAARCRPAASRTHIVADREVDAPRRSG